MSDCALCESLPSCIELLLGLPQQRVVPIVSDSQSVLFYVAVLTLKRMTGLEALFDVGLTALLSSTMKVTDTAVQTPLPQTRSQSQGRGQCGSCEFFVFSVIYKLTARPSLPGLSQVRLQMP